MQQCLVQMYICLLNGQHYDVLYANTDVWLAAHAQRVVPFSHMEYYSG